MVLEARQETEDGHRHLLTGSALLLVGAGIQALSGAVFWLVAARLDGSDDVGAAAGLFTSILFVAHLAGLGLQVSLARYAAGRGEDADSVFTWGVIASGGVTTLVALGFLGAVDTTGTDALADWHPVAGPAVFVAGAIGASQTLIVDVRWMTVRRWGLVVARIAAVGASRFLFLLVPGEHDRVVVLFAAASLPLTASGLFGLVSMARVTGGRFRLRPRPARLAQWVRFSGVNYLSTLAAQAPLFALPVIVLVEVDSATNASFYVAWGITGIALYLPGAIGQVLLAEGEDDHARLRDQVRLALWGTVAVMSVAAVVAWLGRDLVTTVYGDDYAAAARILPGLVACGIPWAATTVWVTEARVRHRSGATLAITTTSTVASLVPAWLLVEERGLDGAVAAFAIGNLAAAAVGLASHLSRPRPEPSSESLRDVEPAMSLHP